MASNVEEYYRQYGPMVLRRCRYILKDEEKALDALQEVFARLLSYQDRLKDAYPSSLLYRMATNECLNMIRAEKRAEFVEYDEAVMRIASLDGVDEQAAVKDLLDRIFEKEQPSTREIAMMHYVDGMTLEETAREAGLSVSGVRKRLRVLRQRVEVMEALKDG